MEGGVVPTRGRLSPAMPLPLPTTLLADMATTSTVLVTLTLTGAPRVSMVSTRGLPSCRPPPPSPFLDFRLLVGVLLVKLVSLEAGGTVAPTRGRLSPAMPLPLPTTLLVAMDTTSTDPATLTLTGLPRASTRGRLSLAMPLPLPTTLLADMATTSTVPATLTLTGAPRVFVSTRGLPSC